MKTSSRLQRSAFALAIAGLGLQAQAAFDTSATASTSAMNVGNVSNTDDGSTAASATADLGRWNAMASAAIGRLGLQGTVGGCVDPTLFQQPCAGSGADARFDDLVHVTGGAPGGTPVQLEFDWSVSGSVNGIGNYVMQSALVVGNASVSVSATGFIDPDVPLVNVPLGGNRSLVVDTVIGANIPIAGWMSLGLTDVACWGGSDLCAASLGWTITADLSHTALASARVLTPGIDVQLVGDSGHDYLAPVPEPSRGLLLAAGLAAIGAARWRRRAGLCCAP